MKKVLASSLVGLTLSLGFVAPSFAAETNTLSEVKLQAVETIQETVSVGEEINLPYRSGYYYVVEMGSRYIDLTNKGVLTGKKAGDALVTIWKDGKMIYKYEIEVVE